MSSVSSPTTPSPVDSIRKPSTAPSTNKSAAIPGKTNLIRSTRGGAIRRLSLPNLPGRRTTQDPKSRFSGLSLASLLPSLPKIRLTRKWSDSAKSNIEGSQAMNTDDKLNAVLPTSAEPAEIKLLALPAIETTKRILYVKTPSTSPDALHFANASPTNPLDTLAKIESTYPPGQPIQSNTNQRIWLCTPPPRSPISPLTCPNPTHPIPPRPRFTTRSISTGRLATEFDADGRVICLSVHSERVFSCPRKSIMEAGGGLTRSQSALEVNDLGDMRRGFSVSVERGRGSLERLVEGGSEDGENGVVLGAPLTRRETEGMSRTRGGSRSPAERMKSWFGVSRGVIV